MFASFEARNPERASRSNAKTGLSEMAFSLGTSSKNGPLTMLSRCCHEVFSSRGHLRDILAIFGAILASLGVILAHLGAMLGHFGVILGSSWPVLGVSWGLENSIFARNVFPKGGDGDISSMLLWRLLFKRPD